MGSCYKAEVAQGSTLDNLDELGRRFQMEGTQVYSWVIHVVLWQKPTQYRKAIILPLQIH